MGYDQKIYERRKKKNNGSTDTVRKPFDELADELKIEILRRIPTNIVADLAYVSKSRFRLITVFCFPKMITSGLPYGGIMLRQLEAPPSPRPVQMLFTLCKVADGVKCPGYRVRYTLSSCNGLHLFCCYNVVAAAAAAEGNSRSETSDSYYVLNLVTYQHVVVASTCVTSLDQTYAAIAYDASESCFFRIVQFQDGQRSSIFEHGHGIEEMLHKIKCLHNELKSAPPSLLLP
ncbi:hypothetical protein L484_011240 [Morus notabilis]|uniref:F-box protein n=1 Tax=Morus notabilis TaxID=981085 RepID=W9SAV4_9ROSA|nr:hypothetical protein L484_011240 [Morus notabilis]